MSSSTTRKSKRVKQQLNRCIREGIVIDDLTQEAIAFDNDMDVNVLRLWSLVKSIKDDMLFTCSNNGPDAYIGLDECDGEGYVRNNYLGMYKLVNRESFSHANFNSTKGWGVGPLKCPYSMNTTQPMTITQTKPQFLTEALIEVCNNEWKVNAIESNLVLFIINWRLKKVASI